MDCFGWLLHKSFSVYEVSQESSNETDYFLKLSFIWVRTQKSSYFLDLLSVDEVLIKKYFYDKTLPCRRNLKYADCIFC